jgi:hypothetical protein
MMLFFVGLILASVTGSAFGAEINAAVINSAEPSKKKNFLRSSIARI